MRGVGAYLLTRYERMGVAWDGMNGFRITTYPSTCQEPRNTAPHRHESEPGQGQDLRHALAGLRSGGMAAGPAVGEARRDREQQPAVLGGVGIHPGQDD